MEAQQELGIPGQVHLTWEITDDYPHFKKKRGYGVTFHNPGEPACHFAYASKIITTDPRRADGVVRHEIGHVADMCIPRRALNRWAAARGYRLPRTSERRADAIAEAIWFEPLRYDRDLVQTTGPGKYPRPLHLGL
jgi:hypothetical protein